MRRKDLVETIFRPGERFRRSELYRSVIRHPRPDTPRGRAMTSFHNFFLHVYPVKVPREVLSFRSTFRLGFISSVLFTILFISGMYLMFFYHPAVPQAYFDMHEMRTSIAFGEFVRNIHLVGPSMVLVVSAHASCVLLQRLQGTTAVAADGVGLFVLIAVLVLDTAL
jgi:hypothetical protein